MLAALTRAVSPTLNACELTWHARQAIDIGLAQEQHRQYETALAELGLHLISLPAEPELPDAVFVEDPVLVLDELAILMRMGAASRRPETKSLAAAISPYRPLKELTDPATMEGGDIMRIGRDLFVGLSSRTNPAGIAQLQTFVDPLGYRVRPVEVRGCLHLKSACCSIGDGKILANSEWLDTAALHEFRIIEVDEAEPGAANVLRIGDTVLLPACFPRTADLLTREGLRIRTMDISELIKAEAAVTCSSVIFEIRTGLP
ncbi:MAG TPA: arginine deiminase family protein [Bryobacteraceae bacterium]|jgi:dimethylargininase|nr:arginine deiminase family protein [Bryobacteraceae bacterium]